MIVYINHLTRIYILFPLILTDVDEVILQWQGSFFNWVRCHTDLKFTEDLSQLVNMEQFLGCSYETARDLIHEFNNSEHFANLLPCQHAPEYLTKLYEKGYRFMAISACSNTQRIYSMRWQNIQQYFPDMFIGLHCVGGEGSHADKYHYLNLYKSAIWVEDQYKHAVAGLAAGHTTFLINYPHNMEFNHPQIIRVTNWADIYDYIKEL